MPLAPVIIPPRRSLVLYALLAILTVIASYLFILLLAVACVWLPIYGLLHIDTVNLRVLLELVLLSLGGIVVAGTLLWSLVPRRDQFIAPGPMLERSAHPRFFGELDQIAASLNEAVPHEVYLIGEPNAFVSDRGGILGVGSRRVMGIGLPFLSTLSVSELRAVLAHEFGHYYGGDTKLGPWVYKTQKAMVRALENLGSVQEGWGIQIIQILFVVVFSLLKWSFGGFLRVINFISRKQEFRADELACIVAGMPPQMQSLKKVRAAAAAWPSYWGTEVVPVLGQGWIPSIGEGFSRYLAAPGIAAQVVTIVEKSIAEEKTGPYDTHPPLRERLRATEMLKVEERQQEVQAASSLFDDPGLLELQFVKFLHPELNKAGLQPVAWDDVGKTVMIPSWKSTVFQYSALVKEVTPESLPDLVPHLGQLGAQMRDPVGRILTGQERAQRMADFLVIALQLALLENGWELVNQPGLFYLHRGDEKIVPQAAVYELASGKITREAWSARCAELGITQTALSSLGEPSAA